MDSHSSSRAPGDGPDAVWSERLGREALFALDVVREAVHLTAAIQDETAGGTITKADASPVTIADFAVQALVAARLARDFPDDALVAEEDATVLRQPSVGGLRARVASMVRRAVPEASTEQVLDWIDRGGGIGPRFWVLDPIDGTKGLLQGRQYVVALALIVNGGVRVGVVGCTRLSVAGGQAGPPDRKAAGGGGSALAVRDRGAWWLPTSGERVLLSVSARADPVHARVLWSYEEQHGDAGRASRALRALGSEEPPIRMDSQAKHVVLAAGEADVLWRFPQDRDFHDAIWDCAAGALLIEEAGGRVTDLAGRALDFTAGRRLLRNHGFLASNGMLHEAALAAVQRHDSTFDL